MQELALKYDDTQCRLLNKARKVEEKAEAEITTKKSIHKKLNSIQDVKPTRLTSSFYKQIVEHRRLLEDLDSKIASLKQSMGSINESEIESKTPFSGVPVSDVAGSKNVSKSRRASVSVRSMLDSTPVAKISSPSPKIFSAISASESRAAPGGHEESKQTLFDRAETDKMALVSENKKLRDLINSLSVDDPESRTIVSELKAWEHERDTLEGQILQQEDYVDSLKTRIANFKSGNV
jgi:hypothetical protein